MNVDIRPEFGGSMRQRLTFQHEGRRVSEFVRAEEWSRSAATEALNLLQYVYKVERRTVRFIHH